MTIASTRSPSPPRARSCDASRSSIWVDSIERSPDSRRTSISAGAQRSGRRVVLAPGARVRIGERFAHRPPSPTGGPRDGSRSPGARSSSHLTLWVLSDRSPPACSCSCSSARGAAREFADLVGRRGPAPWHTGTVAGPALQRKAGRHSLLGLFVPLGTVVRQSADRLHDLIVPSRQATGDPRRDTAAGADPDTEDAMGGPAEHAQAVRNPGLWAVILTTIAAFAAGRTLPNGLASGLRDGPEGN